MNLILVKIEVNKIIELSKMNEMYQKILLFHHRIYKDEQHVNKYSKDKNPYRKIFIDFQRKISLLLTVPQDKCSKAISRKNV